MSPFQRGFIRNRSKNLVTFTVVDKNVQVDVIYTDFAEEFDIVQHDVLLYKLSNIGLNEGAIKLLNSYMSKCDHFVSFNVRSVTFHLPVYRRDQMLDRSYSFSLLMIYLI